MAQPLRVEKEVEEKPGLINGQQCYSTYEWRVAKALWKYKWTFDYQVGFFGGRRVRGGQVIDFLVHTVPNPTPLYVYGEFWHGGPLRDRDALARALLTGFMHGQIREPVVIAGEECHTQQSADEAILKYFGRAS